MQKSSKQKLAKALRVNIKTIGDWIKFKRLEKNLTPGHVALKMGIAASFVCSWESGIRQPDRQQLEILSSVLGFNEKDFETQNSDPINSTCLALKNQP